MEINLITKEDFAPYIDITHNTRVERIQPYIQTAQWNGLRNLLGAAFYDDYVAKYTASVAESSPVAMPANYIALRTWIVPYLVYWSYAGYLPFSNSISTPHGERVKLDRHSEPIDPKVLGMMVARAEANATVRAKDLIEFIEAPDNITNYPLYPKPTTCNPDTRNSGRRVFPVRK